MKSIKAKKDFSLNGYDYFKGDEVKTKDIKEISRLNEKGYIEPLTRKELILLSRELQNNKFLKEEK